MVEKILGAAVHMSKDERRAVIFIRRKNSYEKVELTKSDDGINEFEWIELFLENYFSLLDKIDKPYIMGGEKD